MPYRISRRRLLSLLPALPAARLLSQEKPTFSADVNVVNLFATVRDKDGHIVTNLNKEEFALQEDGRPQTIRYFSRETDLPLTLGLLVDTSMSQRSVIGAERSASSSFLEHVVREDKDKAFLIHFDKEVELLQDLTSSRAKLDKAVRELEVADRSEQHDSGGGGGRHGGGGGGHHGGGTTLYDSILLASDELMKKQTGRKAVVILSDGVDRGSKVSITEAIEHAQRSDTVAYSILFTGGEHAGGFGGFGGGGFGGMGRRGGMGRPQGEERPDGKKVLERIAKETGGGFFEVSKKHPIEQTFDQIQEELRSQYTLGYVSDASHAALGYRKIVLTANRKGVVVQTRDGYYPAG
jgi:VWFA-related protein